MKIKNREYALHFNFKLFFLLLLSIFVFFSSYSLLQTLIKKTPKRARAIGRYPVRKRGPKRFFIHRQFVSNVSAKDTKPPAELVQTIKKQNVLYAIVKNTLFSYVQKIQQYFYQKQQPGVFPVVTAKLLVDYTIPTFTVNLMLPDEQIVESVISQLNRYEKQITDIAHILFVTPQQKIIVYEVKNPTVTDDLQSKRMIFSEVKTILSDQKQLSSILKKGTKINPDSAETITLVIDLDKTKGKIIQKLKTNLEKYEKNNTWKRINILFLRNKQVTSFQITRDQNTDIWDNITHKLSIFLKDTYQSLIASIKKIQEEPFFTLEQLSVKKALSESFTKKQ
jgi:hypothetical protein